MRAAVVHAEVHEAADGSAGGPVVLLHGLGSRAADWRFQIPAFQAVHRVVAVDLHGHGGSPLPVGRCSVEGMARDVAALLGRRGEAAAHVIGLSLGACVALRLTLQEPARVRTLTLVNGFARWQPAGGRGAARALLRLALLVGAPMPVVAAHVAGTPFPGPDQRHLYAQAVASLTAVSRRAYLANLRALARFDVRGQLAAVRRPTLVVAGACDRTVPLAAKRAPRARHSRRAPGRRAGLRARDAHGPGRRVQPRRARLHRRALSARPVR